MIDYEPDYQGCLNLLGAIIGSACYDYLPTEEKRNAVKKQIEQHPGSSHYKAKMFWHEDAESFLFGGRLTKLLELAQMDEEQMSSFIQRIARDEVDINKFKLKPQTNSIYGKITE